MAVTLKDIARACEVDVATASRSLNGAYGVRAETRQRILDAARRLQYRPNRIARGLVTGRSRTLAMVVGDIRNPFYAELARGVEDAAYRAGYELVLCNCDLSSDRQMHYIHSLLEKRVDGILLSAVARLNSAEQLELSRSDAPIVLLNRPPGGARGYSTVLADNYRGGWLAGETLAGLGHRKILLLADPRDNGNLAARETGFLKALQARSGGAAPLILRAQHNSEGARHALAEYLHARAQRRRLPAAPPRGAFTALFAVNDAMAIGATRAIFEAGLNVPLDISVIGFDDIEFSGMLRPPLTTIHQPKYEMGRAAVEILLRHVGKPAGWMPEHRTMEVRLVMRESCRALRA